MIKPAWRLCCLPAMGLLIAGCDQIGSPLDAVRGNVPAPDEFQVLATKPLQMPGTLSLPEPRLGERSPLEPDPQADATAALLGAGGATVATTASPGEVALLGAASPDSDNPDIRRTLVVEAASEDDGPYEAPTLSELLSGDEQKQEDALDPAAEARRLQAEGVAAAPVDPNAIIIPDSERNAARRAGEGLGSNPTAGGLNRPENPLSKGTVTKF